MRIRFVGRFVIDNTLFQVSSVFVWLVHYLEQLGYVGMTVLAALFLLKASVSGSSFLRPCSCSYIHSSRVGKSLSSFQYNLIDGLPYRWQFLFLVRHLTPSYLSLPQSCIPDWGHSNSYHGRHDSFISSFFPFFCLIFDSAGTSYCTSAPESRPQTSVSWRNDWLVRFKGCCRWY